MSAGKNQDTLALSRLDVISCALGAAILLFLSLSAIRVQRPSQTSAERFIQVSVELTEGVSRTDSPVITFFVTPPGETYPIDVPAFAFDGISGRLDRAATALPDFMRLSTRGLFQIAGSALEQDRAFVAEVPTAHLSITNPDPGEWVFQFAVTNSKDPFTTVGVSDEPSLRTAGVMRAISRSSRVIHSESSTVTAGKLSRGVSITVE